jgi:hypothetical protein
VPGRSSARTVWLIAVIAVVLVAAVLLVVAGAVVLRQLVTAAQPLPQLVTALPSLTPTSAVALATFTPLVAGPSASAPPTHTPPPVAALTETSVPGTATRPSASPTASLTTVPPTPTHTATAVPPTATFSPTPTDTAVPPTETPTPTATPSATPTATSPPAALAIRNDQGCLRAETNQLYIFGELHNPGPASLEVFSLTPRVFDGGAELTLASQFFDLPGDFFVAPGASLPFVAVAVLPQAQFTRYELQITAEPSEPGARNPRPDLRIESFTAVPELNVVEVSGIWSHTGARPAEFVAIVAAAYNDQGRVVNMNHLFITNTTPLNPNLPPGQQEFADLTLAPSPCGEGAVTVTIFGE